MRRRHENAVVSISRLFFACLLLILFTVNNVAGYKGKGCADYGYNTPAKGKAASDAELPVEETQKEAEAKAESEDKVTHFLAAQVLQMVSQLESEKAGTASIYTRHFLGDAGHVPLYLAKRTLLI
jgi:hypothetical protein